MKTARNKNLVRDKQGTTATEMGLIYALIVLVMITALQGFAVEGKSMWNRIATMVSTSNQAASSG